MNIQVLENRASRSAWSLCKSVMSMSNKSVEQVGSDLLISSKKASIARFPFGLGTAGGDGDCSHVAKSRSRTDQHTLDGSNARMGRECASDRDNPDGV
jgi:hypothetical protein